MGTTLVTYTAGRTTFEYAVTILARDADGDEQLPATGGNLIVVLAAAALAAGLGVGARRFGAGRSRA